MKSHSARAILAILMAFALSSIPDALSQENNRQQSQSQSPDPAKARANEAASPASASDEKTAAGRPEGLKSTNLLQNDKLQLSTNLVNVVVSVTDPYGRFVTGLTRDHFDIFDDKVKQQIAHFSDEDAPISMGVVYDVSGSMKERIARSVRALKRFIETSHDDDDFFLIGFNERAKLVQDFTTSGDQITGHLMFVQPKGSTALYDAAYLAVEKVQQGRHTKKALLIISDGQDNNSRYTYKELRNRVKEADVQIYAIGITDPASDSLAGFGRSVLEEITRMTGGRSFFPNAYNEPELVEICTRIALELRHQYSIGFYPSNVSSESKWHKVQVKVNPPKGLGRLSLSYKDGYQSFKK
ncbi:MAG TPA: VWA domain-containing protein [Blastocatellia bacterium]|nr:VWA domain-containing protein [Blastocatellia bacterium]